MDTLNSADLRNNLAQVLQTVVEKKKPVLVGRFGQPKVVLIDFFTYNWQNQVLKLLSKIKKLNSSEIETLNILLDEKTRKSLFAGLAELEQGDVVSIDEIMKE